MKIIFVGMNNKPDKKPLCSTTKSGKRIDRIISNFHPAFWCEKTNLYDVDFHPEEKDKIGYAHNWLDRVNPMVGDIVVLLGADVHKNFKKPNYEIHLIKIAHPASARSRESIENYITNCVKLITEKIKKNDKH